MLNRKKRLAVFQLAFSVFLSAGILAGEGSAQDFEIIALAGDNAPGTNTTFGSFTDELELEFDGDVSFLNNPSSPIAESLFQQLDGTIVPLAIDSEPFPGLMFVLDGVPIYDRTSSNEFIIGTNTTSSFSIELLVKGDTDGQFQEIVQQGQSLPGSPPDFLFNSLDQFTLLPSIADNGVVAVPGEIRNPNNGQVSQGIWADRNDGNGIVPILVEDTQWLNGECINSIQDYEMNNNGLFVVEAGLTGDNFRHIFGDLTGSLGIVSSFENALELELNDNNNVAVINRCELPMGVVEFQLIVGPPGQMGIVAKTGDPAPGFSGVALGDLQTNNSGVSRLLELNNRNESVFLSMLTGTGVSSANDEAVWKHSESGQLELVARKGDQAPGTSMVFGDLIGTTFFEVEINDRGQVALLAVVNDGTDDFSGIWVQDMQGQLQLVMIEGQQIDIDPGPGEDLRTITRLRPIQDLEMNKRGQLAFFSGLGSSSLEALFRSNVGYELIPGDTNGDGFVNLLDVEPFIDILSAGGFLEEADINGDGFVNLLDVQPFIALLSGG